jgi:O-antigen/teichoic acid export membrane protein
LTIAEEPSPGSGGSSILAGAAAATAGQLVAYALAFAMSVVLARALGPAGRGQYYLAITAAAVCVALVNLGVEQANVVLLARRRFSLAQLARTSGTLALLVGPVAAFATIGVYEATRSTVFQTLSPSDIIIAAATIPISLHSLWLANVFLLAKRLPRTYVALVAGTTLQLSGALLLVAFAGLDVTGALLLFAGALVTTWLVMIFWSGDVAPVRPSFDFHVVRAVVGFGVRFQLGLVVLFLLLRVDVFLVAAYRGPHDVGLYSLAVLFAELTWLLTNPLVQAVVPFQAERPLRESAVLAFKAARFNFVLAGALSIFFTATLWFALPLIYGASFRAAYPALVALLPGVWLMAGVRPLTVLVARDARGLAYSLLVLVAFAVNIGLNVLLIPRLGIVGASLSSTVGYAALAIGLLVWALRLGELAPRTALLPQPDDVRTVQALAGRVAAVRARRRR